MIIGISEGMRNPNCAAGEGIGNGAPPVVVEMVLHGPLGIGASLHGALEGESGEPKGYFGAQVGAFNLHAARRVTLNETQSKKMLSCCILHRLPCGGEKPNPAWPVLSKGR